MGLQFHETVYGKRYFEYQFPKLIDTIERLANAVEKQNKLLEEGIKKEEKMEGKNEQ